MKITLAHNDQVIEANDSDSLFIQLKRAGLAIKSTCGGCASCGQCVIVVEAGKENLQEATFEEKQLLGNVFHITKERLSCQTYLNGDVTIDISRHLEQEQKSKTTVVRRTKEQALAVKEERIQKRKEINENRPKRLGGGKRPRAFNFQNESEENSEE